MPEEPLPPPVKGEPVHRSPFIIEPENMLLKKDEEAELTLWAFPDEAKEYKDELVCLVKDNPNPLVYPIVCMGCKPEVKVDNEKVEFDRLLLNQTITKVLKIKNVSWIPVKWHMTGLETKPKQFTISVTEGQLKPCEEIPVQVTFCSEN